MSDLSQLLQSPAVTTFVTALLHTLWQGVLWGGLLAMGLHWAPVWRPSLRYNLAVASLFGLVLTFLGTWSAIQHQSLRTAEPAPVINIAPLPAIADRSEHTSAVLPPLEAAQETVLSQAVSGSWPEIRFATFVPWLAAIWCLGVGYVLIGNLRSLLAVRQLVAATPATDDRLQKLLQSVQQRLRVWQPITLCLTNQLDTPAIWGIIRPILLLPVSLATNLSDTELEAIFAHELAHVRRYDQIVNLAQLLIEAVFFFNPAVWWISRQIRREREACCDAAAVALVAGPVHYVEMLTHTLPQRSSSPIALTALAGNDGGSMLDRVRRLLQPGYRPDMHLSWWTCLCLTFMTAGVFYTLYRGTDLAVQLLTDEERIAIVSEQAQQLSPDLTSPPGTAKMHVTGRIEFEGGPPAEYVHVHTNERTAGLSRGSSREALKSPYTFNYEFDPCKLSLTFSAQGYAPAALGPFQLADGPAMMDRVVRLRVGHEVELNVVDENGEPAAGVSVSAAAIVDGSGSHFTEPNLKTDDRGYVLLKHVPDDLPVSLSLRGPGYQEQSVAGVSFPVGQKKIVNVSRARPVLGQVLNTTGQPVSSAEFRLLLETSPGSSHHHGGSAKAGFVTDAEGNFQIGELKDGRVYTYVVEHPDYGPALLENVEPGARNIQVVLPEKLTVTGHLEGMPENAEANQIYWAPLFKLEKSGPYQRELQGRRQKLQLSPDGQFQLSPVSRGKLVFTQGAKQQQIEIPADGQEFVVKWQDLAPQPADWRDVEISFAHRGKVVSPEGSISLSGSVALPGETDTSTRQFYVKDGKLRCRVRPGDYFSLYEPNGLIGYWFSSGDVQIPNGIPAGLNPYQITVPCYPAGSVHGLVLQVDGSPAAEINMGLKLKFEVPANQSFDGKQHTYSSSSLNNFKTDANGRFLMTPVPLNAECRLTASQGFNREARESFTLTNANPTRNYNVQFSPTVDLQARVTDPAGQPVRGFPVELYYEDEIGGNSWLPPQVTDANGMVTFAGCNKEHSSQYTAIVKGSLTYVWKKYPLNSSGVTELRLEPGKRLTGMVIDQNSQSVAGANLWITLQKPGEHLDLVSYMEPNVASDEMGKFTLNCLPPVPVNIRTHTYSMDRAIEIIPGEEQVVVLKVKRTP